ncbi:MAG TPA: hypothetical protein VGX23_01540 [Actinocrinis sp.]|nr:hypothetical protein [Actinocrinis sp.]
MPYRLLNVEDAVRTSNGLKVEPGVRLRALLGRIPDEDVPVPGDLLEIRFPDGGEDRAQVAAFGWEGFDAGGGKLYLNTDPSDPRFSLTIAGDLQPTAVPRGSEIWLIDHGPARRWNTGRGWDLIAQMARLSSRLVDPGSMDLAADPTIEPAAEAAEPEVEPVLDPVLDAVRDPAVDRMISAVIDPALRPRRSWRRFWRR